MTIQTTRDHALPAYSECRPTSAVVQHTSDDTWATTPGATSFPHPRTFFWLPIDGKRHAADIRDRNLPSGKLITTLCGRQLTRPRVTDAE
ncbi:MAG: zinc finger protein [Pseudonocardiaceae bacterium]